MDLNKISEAISKVGRLFVFHDNFSDVLDSILTELEYGATDSIIVVPGPTGIGKTHLAKLLIKKLSDHADKVGRGRPVFVEAETAHGGGFKWRDLYLDVMRELQEPCIESKTDLEAALDKLRVGAPLSSSYSTTYGAARRAMNECLEYNEPVAVIIDEAQHIGTSYPSISGGRYLDVCKGLANKKKTSYVLLGTLEIECMLNTSAQISKRTNVIDFERYLRNKNGITAILTVLQQSLELLKIDAEFSVANHDFEIYDSTLGCVGLLIEWLERALKRAKKSGRNALIWKDFDLTRLSTIKLETMAREIETYRLSTERKGSFDYHRIFKLRPGEIRTPGSIKNPQGNGRIAAQRKPGKRKPGKRDPGRDAVG